MANGSSGGRGLNYTANLNIDQVKKNSAEAIALFKKMNDAAKLPGNESGQNKAFDVKPLTEYQAAQVKIKQEALDLAKAKQDQSTADKTASLALQNALKEERLAREAILTQIAQNKLAQQQANVEAKAAADLQRQISSQKRPTQVSNSQAEIDAYNRAAKGSILYTSAINAQIVAESKLTTVAAAQAASTGNLSLATSSSATNIKQDTAATNENANSKKLSAAQVKELAVQLAAEKIRQQQSTAETKNNAREQLNAKGSIDQRKAALERLVTAYARLSVAERESAAGNRMADIIKGVRDQIKGLEDQTKSSKSGLADFFDNIKNNIIGTLGPLALLTAAWAALKSAFDHNVEISDSFVDVQRTAKLSGEEVDDLSDKLKKINTRTSLEGLLDIGFEGGRLGVQKDELVDFITTVDKLSVVLKKELPGGAEAVATSLGKIVKIYKIAENEGISLGEAMNKVGSSQLELAHSGGVTVKYLQDFTLGVAGTATTAKLSLPVIEGYGAVLSNAGTIASSAALSITRLVNDLSNKKPKYFAIAQLADSTLTIEKFTKLINTDTKGALDAFFKGLKAGNPTQDEFNLRIKSVGITAGKVSNAVKVLANNYDLLQGKLAIGTKGYDEATSVSHNFELANNSLAASFDKIKNGIVNYFTSAENGRALASLLNSLTDTRSESEKLSEEYIDNKKQLDELEGALKPLTDRYDALQKKVKEVGGVSKLTKTDQDELREVTARIGEILPGVTTKFDEFGNSIAISRDKIRDLTKAQRELLLAQNRDGIDKANDDFTESQRKAAAQIKIAQDLASQVGQQYGRKQVTDKVVRDASDYAKVLVGQSYAAAKALVTLGGTLNANQKKVVDYFEAVDKAKKNPKQKQEVLGTGELADEVETARTTEVIKGEIKALQEADKKLSTTSDEFKANIAKIKDLRKELKLALGGKDTDAISAANQYATALKARNDLQAKIDELVKKGTDKQLSADDQEVESVKDKYAKMREEAIKFNNDPKNVAKGLRTDLGGIANAQKTELTSVNYKQDTAKLIIELDKQKDLYAQYEQYKTDFGEDAAKKRFEDDLNIQATYLQKLEAERDRIQNIAPSQRTGAEKDRLTVVKSRIDEEVKAKQASYAALLVELRSYQDQVTATDDKYAKKKKDILDKADENGPEKTAHNIKLLGEEYAADTDALKDSVLQKSEAYKHLNDEVIRYTKSQLKAEIDAIEFTLKNATGMSDKLKAALQSQLGELKVKLSLGGDDKAFVADLQKKKAEIEQSIEVGVKVDDNGNLTIVKLTTAEYKEQVRLLGLINGKIKETTAEKYNTVAKYLDLAASSFEELSQAVGDSNQGLANTFLALSQVAKAGAEASKAFAVLTDPKSTNFDKIQAGVNGLTSALTTIFSAGAKRKKDLEDYYRSVTAMQNDYNVSLNEQLKLQSTLDESIYLKNYTGRVGDAMKAASDAQKKLNELIPQLGNGQAVTGKRNAVDWGAVGKAAAGGAVAGATVGSIVPVIGTIVGGAVGAVVGFLGGLFGGKQKVDTLAPLLKEYPELITKMQDGTVSFNAELAKSLVANNLVTDATKDVLNNIVDWQKQLEAARQQIKDVVTELSGSLGNDLRDALVQSFKDGTSAAKAFGDSVNKVLENILSNILFNAVFSDTLKQLEADLTTALDPTNSGGKSVIDALAAFFDKAPSLIDSFDALLGSSHDLAASKGLDVFGKTQDAPDTPSAIQGTITAAGLTQDTGNELKGIFRGTYDLTKTGVKTMGDIYLMSVKHFTVAQEISANTLRTANNTDALNDMAKDMKQVVKNTTTTNTGDPFRNAGIKL